MDLTLKTGESDSESCSVMSDSLLPHGLYGPWNSPGQNTRVGNFSRGSSQPRDRTQVSCTAGGFLPSEPLGKPKNTGVDSLSLLQQIFPTQESNQVSCIAGGFFTNWAKLRERFGYSSAVKILANLSLIASNHQQVSMCILQRFCR